MAVLETIRVKFGVLITVLIAIALLSFIVDPSVFNSCASGNGQVAEIEGEGISYIDYQTETEKARMVFDLDQRTRGQVNTAAIQGYVWSKMLSQHGFFQKYDQAGVLASDYNVAAILQSDPQYNYMAAYRNQRPEIGLALDDMSYRTKSLLYSAQYDKLFQMSSFANPLAIANEMNEKSDKTEFVEIPVTGAENITVSEEEVKAWYDSHIEGFKLSADRKNNRNIEFAVFELNPSEADIEKARLSAAQQLDEMNAKELDEFSETRYYMENELNSESAKLDDFVFAKENKTSDLISDGNTFYAVRILDSQMLPDSVEFICVPASGENTADSLFTADAENFKMTYNQLDESFMDASIFTTAKNNKGFVATTKSQQNLLVKVISTSKKSLHKRISYIKEAAYVSEETDNNVSELAYEFASKVSDYATFSTELASLGQKDSFHMTELSSQMYDLPYEGRSLTNARELIKWAFNAKAGQVSGVIKLDQAYVVASIDKINTSGYVPFDIVKSNIENVVRSEKRLAQMSEEIKSKIAGLDDMSAIAKTLGAEVNVEDIIFSYTNNDPKFVGAVSASEVDKIYGPLVGMNSIFIYKVVSREDRNPMLEEEITNRKNYPYYENYIVGTLNDAIYGSLKIKDDRVNFM